MAKVKSIRLLRTQSRKPFHVSDIDISIPCCVCRWRSSPVPLKRVVQTNITGYHVRPFDCQIIILFARYPEAPLNLDLALNHDSRTTTDGTPLAHQVRLLPNSPSPHFKNSPGVRDQMLGDCCFVISIYFISRVMVPPKSGILTQPHCERRLEFN